MAIAQKTEARSWPCVFSALTVGGSDSLGADIRLDVSPKTTVLVGRNGAGKSALLEDISLCAQYATTFAVVGSSPRRFGCELHQIDDPSFKIQYDCSWDSPAQEADGNASIEQTSPDDVPTASIRERCRVFHGDDESLAWEVKDGWLCRSSGTREELSEGRGLLHPRLGDLRKGVPVLGDFPLSEMLRRYAVPRICAGVPRAGSQREAVLLPHPWRLRFSQQYRSVPRGIRVLSSQITDWYHETPDLFHELEAISQRLKLLAQIKVTVFDNPAHTADPRSPPQLTHVSVDGTNLGLLSDGTLRVLEILAALIAPKVSLLLIEEPEMAVHPGLLERLLHEVDAYTTDRQVILSTQSPQVVSWARPESMRLVTRTNAQTQVRSLNEAERVQIDRYLHDEGTLGDYIYSSSNDDNG